MQEGSLKKVLTLSITCWNSNNGSDTLSNLFSEYDPKKVANIYFKEDYPNSKSCANYFLISESRVIKSILFRNKKTGTRISNFHSVHNEMHVEKEKEESRYCFFSKFRTWFLILVREFLWILGKWKTDELDSFIEDFKPDILFSPFEGYIYFNRVLIYIAKKYQIPVYIYIWDDNFTFKQHRFNVFYLIHRVIIRHQIKIIKKYTKIVYLITPKAKKEFQLKNKDANCKILTKFIEHTPEFHEYKVKNKVTIAYSGKIDKGRLNTIKKLKEAINLYNNGHLKKISLDIFSQTKLSKKDIDSIQSEFVVFRGFVEKRKLIGILQNYNVLVHVEPINGIDKHVSRLSFSTKLIDYLSIGKPILCFSLKTNATYEYLMDNRSAICFDSFKNIDTIFNSLFNTKFMNKILENEKKMILKFHNCKKRKEFYKELNGIGEKNDCWNN